MSTDNSQQRHSSRSLIKATSVISLGTLSSRILGFIRDMVLAKFFGTGWTADAFFVAWRIPNLFRDFLGEGAVNSTVVPVFSEYLKDGKELRRFIGIVFYAALLILSAVTILGMVGAPVLVRLIAPGFALEPEKLDLSIRLTRIIFPYLVLIGLTAYSMGVLYTFRAFWVPAFSPCLLNVAMIASVFFVAGQKVEAVYALAAGVLAGGVLQLLAQMAALFKRGVVFGRPEGFAHPGLTKIARLLVPRMFGAGVYQLNVFVDTFCASLSMIVGQGGISAIYFANRLAQFPVGIFGFAMASAALPTMSGFAEQNNIPEFKKTVEFSLKNIFLVMIPASVFLAVLSKPVIHVLFERGAFDAYSTHITSQALLFYALGLFSFAGLKILVTAFHALQDTTTPVKAAVVALVLNVILNFLLMGPLKIGGIALASSIASTVNFVLLFRRLKERIGFSGEGIPVYTVKVFGISLLMAVAALAVWNYLQDVSAVLALACAVGTGVLVFPILCYLFKIEQLHDLKRWIFEKK